MRSAYPAVAPPPCRSLHGYSALRVLVPFFHGRAQSLMPASPLMRADLRHDDVAGQRSKLALCGSAFAGTQACARPTLHPHAGFAHLLWVQKNCSTDGPLQPLSRGIILFIRVLACVVAWPQGPMQAYGVSD